MSSTAVPDILVSGEFIDVGDVAQITILTKNASAVLTDPSSLVVKVQPLGGSVVTYTYGTDAQLTKSSTGTYLLKHPVTAGTRHHVRAITTGDAGAEPGFFDARASNISE